MHRANQKITEPSTGNVLGKVANCSLEDFQAAIDDAHRAQPKYYRLTTAAQRGSFLRHWNDLILANKQDRECLKD